MESRLNLRGKVAFVTGSTRGIGWSCAQLLAQEGATVLLNGVSNAGLLQERVAQLKAAHGIETEGFLMDASSPEAIRDCYSAIFKKFKRLDVLVNNAGIMKDSLLGMISPEAIEETFRVNVQSVILNMQYAARLMGRNGGGSIINLSSIIGRFGNAGQIAYGASKAAVIGATLSAAKELAPANIRVNAVAPGFIETDMTKQLPPEKASQRMAGIAMKRIGKPEEVAGAVVFLASDLSSYVTGQVLGVDGGMVV